MVNYIVKCKSHKYDNCSVIINKFCYFSERTCNGFAVFWPTTDLAEI